MFFFAHRSIKVKLMLLFTATASVALLFACGAFWLYAAVSYLSNLRQESSTVAQMLAGNSAAAITFGDKAAAGELLSSLHAEPRILEACLYDKTNKPFAVYQRPGEDSACPPPTTQADSRFTSSFLFLHVPVNLQEERIGDLYLKVSLAEMYHRLSRFAMLGLLVLCVASLVAVGLSSRWQRLISEPILHLTQVAEQVSLDSNYSLRAAKTSNDEIGILIGQFNAMMEQINRRDQALKDAQDRLELRVAERTRALRDEIAERKVIEHDLLNAKISAEESNRAKSEFLANMSHELRTPLNAVIGYSEMLEEDATADGNESAVSDLRRIQNAGRHLLALVSDILDLSKIEAGRFDLSMEWVPVSAIVDKVTQTIEPLARKNGNRFTVHHERWDKAVYVDSTKFYQSLVNLLGNACKFTENGTISLTIEPRTEEGQEWICWSVQDTGIGISESDIGKLFRAFTQVDSSATRRYGGTGLGLAISQRLCRMMGGQITVSSEVGKGTNFTIHMPAAAEGDSAANAAAGQAEAAA